MSVCDGGGKIRRLATPTIANAARRCGLCGLVPGRARGDVASETIPVGMIIAATGPGDDRRRPLEGRAWHPWLGAPGSPR